MVTDCRIKTFFQALTTSAARGKEHTYDIRVLLQRKAAAIYLNYSESLRAHHLSEQKKYRLLAVGAAADARRLMKLAGYEERAVIALRFLERDLNRMLRFPGKLRKFGLPEKGISGDNKRF